MEQQPPQGGETQHPQLHEQQPAQPGERLTHGQLIHLGITEALREQRPIDHATARAIAAQLDGDQASPLYALASSGALVDGLRAKLDGWRREDTPVELEPWLDALDEYLDSRAEEPGQVEGWSQLWPTGPRRDQEGGEPETGNEVRREHGTLACTIGRQAVVSASLDGGKLENDEAQARQALFQQISAAGVTTLGEIGTVEAADQEDEPDPFPWTDAATWSPTEAAREHYADAELDALFIATTPDDLTRALDALLKSMPSNWPVGRLF